MPCCSLAPSPPLPAFVRPPLAANYSRGSAPRSRRVQVAAPGPARSRRSSSAYSPSTHGGRPEILRARLRLVALPHCSSRPQSAPPAAHCRAFALPHGPRSVCAWVIVPYTRCQTPGALGDFVGGIPDCSRRAAPFGCISHHPAILAGSSARTSPHATSSPWLGTCWFHPLGANFRSPFPMCGQGAGVRPLGVGTLCAPRAPADYPLPARGARRARWGRACRLPTPRPEAFARSNAYNVLITVYSTDETFVSLCPN